MKAFGNFCGIELSVHGYKLFHHGDIDICVFADLKDTQRFNYIKD